MRLHRLPLFIILLVVCTHARAAAPIVELRGDGQAIGAEHGRQLGEQIRFLRENYLLKIVKTDTMRFAARAEAAMFHTKLSPQHAAEVDALAKAAQMDPSDAMLAQCFLDLMPITACSSIALPADASPHHVARLGRNLDFKTLGIADKHSVLFIYHPEGRFAFASIGWPGVIGCLSGMNEHGLCLANMEVTRAGTKLPFAMPYTLLYRTILEQCCDVDEAIALLQKTPRQTANNLILMDAAGNRAVVEITQEKIVVRKGADGAALISTNHQRGGDQDSPGQCDRYDRLHDTSASEFGKIDVDEIRAMLKSVQQGNSTMQSMIFEPANRIIYLSTGKRAAEGEFVKIDLKNRL
jgi:predicted choloylglycine hydrolase